MKQANFYRTVLILIFLSAINTGTIFAQTNQSRAQGEFSLGTDNSLGTFAFTIGSHSPKGYGFELMPFFGLDDESGIMGNVVISNLVTKDQPATFFSFGAGVCKHGIFLGNVGGGVKIKLTEEFGTRTEVRYYNDFQGELSGLILFAGLAVYL